MYYKENIMQKLMPTDVPQNKILIRQHCLNIYFLQKTNHFWLEISLDDICF